MSSDFFRTGLTTVVFLAVLAAILVPLTVLVSGDADTFTASATVNNQGPTVTADSDQSATGIDGQTKTIYVLFNASDPNGNGDLNDATASVVLTSGSEILNSTGCTNSVINANSLRYNCSVSLYYYSASGSWDINASVSDDSGSYNQDLTQTLSVNELDVIHMISASVSFTGNAGAPNVAASPNPQRINNTGNKNYVTIALTAQDFTDGSNLIGAGNVTMNITNSGGDGDVLIDGTPVTITDATLDKGLNSLRSVYFWLDIPAAKPSGSYNAQSAWNVAAS